MSKLARLLVCLMLVATSSVGILKPQNSFAKPNENEEAEKKEVVYATKRGKKYHKEDCPFLKNRETITLSEKEAKEKGLRPCGRCFEEE